MEEVNHQGQKPKELKLRVKNEKKIGKNRETKSGRIGYRGKKSGSAFFY